MCAMTQNTPTLTSTHTQDLAERLWGPIAGNRLRQGFSYEAYKDFYQRQWTLVARHDAGRHVALRDPQVMNNFVQRLATFGEKTRSDILDELKVLVRDGAADEALSNTLHLALNLLLMLKFNSVKGEVGLRRCLQWNVGSLHDFVQRHFNKAPSLSTDRLRLPKSFNAWSLQEVGGIQVVFTDNLADHLLLVDDDTKVFVFHHATILQSQMAILPVGLAEETVKTLALLFPQSDFGASGRIGGGKARWFRRLKSHATHFKLDNGLVMCGTLKAGDRQLDGFWYWKDRLIILKEAYDEATPRALSQWWHDRRNGVQWYTFWIAIMVFVVTTTLGIVQCIEGALQLSREN